MIYRLITLWSAVIEIFHDARTLQISMKRKFNGISE
jgi:hypothetical protein